MAIIEITLNILNLSDFLLIIDKIIFNNAKICSILNTLFE